MYDYIVKCKTFYMNLNWPSNKKGWTKVSFHEATISCIIKLTENNRILRSNLNLRTTEGKVQIMCAIYKRRIWSGLQKLQKVTLIHHLSRSRKAVYHDDTQRNTLQPVQHIGLKTSLKFVSLLTSEIKAVKKRHGRAKSSQLIVFNYSAGSKMVIKMYFNFF